ncbi:MAG: DUF2807 domain-containing protein [Bacteroidetes bacterium]|nr:DUF2807 domain-containing protein [Bacteroidota bacterium]MBM3424401.1 hypothetical protein [Bacteroidota bacterium]
MKTIICLSLILTIVVFTACKKTESTVLERPIEGYFDTLVLADVFDVELIQDSLNKLEIIGNERFLKRITPHLSQNTLTLTNDNQMLWLFPESNKIHVKVHFSKISKVVANETCFIRSKLPVVANELGLILKSKLNQADLNVQCTTFYFWNNFPCGGSVQLRGQCQELKLWNYALMEVDATELLANTARVENDSKGDIHLRCLDSLFYKISGEGNIELYGNPASIYDLGSTGSGKLSLH